MKNYNIKGRYYAIHSLVNSIVIYDTFNSLLPAFTNLSEINSNNKIACITCASLHVYHIALYYDSLRFDDWLHHILMILVVLPLSMISNSGHLLGYGLFFLTGLPGCIDYCLLFLVKNKWINRITEKKYNKLLNLWIRGPGCVSTSTLIIVYFNHNYNRLHFIDKLTCFVNSILIFWNGLYFMDQVICDYTKKIEKL